MSDRDRSRSRSRSPPRADDKDDKPNNGDDADGVKLYVGNLDYGAFQIILKIKFK
jgi:hypothetical protein